MLRIASPNFYVGRLAAVELAVLHTAQAPCRAGVAEAVMRYLARPEVRASAHWCTDPAATVDDQDLIAAIDASPGKIRPTDDTPAKIKARLAAELTKAKADREAGKPIGREKPAAKVEQPVRGGGAVRAPR